MKKNLFFLLISSILVISSCREEDPELGTAPTTAEASFTYIESTISPNIIQFKANKSDAIASWDFGNGTSAQGTSVSAIYPNKGTYTVKLTIFSKGGSASTSQELIIVADDPSLLNDPLFTMLTGGVDSIDGKTWVMDSAYADHFGVGPNPSGPLGNVPQHYAATANEKSGTGLYNDEYVFKIAAFGFDMITNGLIYVHTDHKDNFTGSYQEKGDYNAPFPNQLGESWNLEFDAGSDTTLTFSGDAFLGMNTNVSTYRILSITEDVMHLRYLHDGNSELAWYLRLVRKGYDSGAGGGGGGTTGVTLPIDFEGTDPGFTSFNGSTASVVSNPNSAGINVSANVLETVKGGANDAGIFVDLGSKLDFSSNSKITFKLFNPNPFASGICRVKLEDQSNPQNSVEIDVNITGTPSWINYEADFTGSTSGQYDRIVLFPGWATTGTDTYHIDDIEQK